MTGRPKQDPVLKALWRAWMEALIIKSNEQICPPRKQGIMTMAKAYWVAMYRSVSDDAALAAYARLSGPAVVAGGGRILVRGLPAHTYEGGLQQRTVVIEFDSVAQARAAHDSPAYQEALALLGDGAERDIRILEGA